MSRSRQVALNKAQGAQFEKLLVARAGVSGCRALKNELSFRYLAGGRIRPIRADLDYRILRRDGRVAYIDTKCFDAEHFTFSQIDADQLRQSIAYNHYNVPSGFVVWLKAAGIVVYYPGAMLMSQGPKTRFVKSHGYALGAPYTFDVSLIFTAHGL